jgi:MFS family permease
MSNNKTMRQWLAQIEPWWMVLVLLFIYMISILDRLVINMLVVPIQADMGFSDVQMSLLLGPAFALCNGLFGLPLGWAADRYSRRWVVFGGLVFWSLSTMAAGLTRSFTSLFGARMGVGIGEAALMPAAYSLIADKFPVKRMTTAMSIFGMGPSWAVPLLSP